MGDDNQNGRPQFVNVHILFALSKHDECRRPQLLFIARGTVEQTPVVRQKRFLT